MPELQHSFAEISFPQQLSGPSSSSPPGCSTPDQLSQLLSIPRLEHRWTLRHHSKAISNIATCVGFKHCPWSQRLKVLRTAKRLLKEQGRTFTLEGYFFTLQTVQSKTSKSQGVVTITQRKRRRYESLTPSYSEVISYHTNTEQSPWKARVYHRLWFGPVGWHFNSTSEPETWHVTQASFPPLWGILFSSWAFKQFGLKITSAAWTLTR